MSDINARLEAILNLENPRERLDALLVYARQNKINVHKAKNDDGVYSENELVVLIYDAAANRQKIRNSNIGMLVLAVIIAVALLGGIALTYYLTTSSRPTANPAEDFETDSAQ